jgi:membrane protease YdiL (CAAX protease family)
MHVRPVPSTPITSRSKRTLLIELAVVTVVVFGTATVSAVIDLAGRLLNVPVDVSFFVVALPGNEGLAVALGCAYLVVRMGAVIGLVAYVLRRSGESFRVLGLSVSGKRRDLMLIAPFAALAIGLQHVGFLLPHPGPSAGGQLTAPSLYAVTGVLRSLESGIVEELIVLAFVLTRLRQLGVHPLAAVLISALIRASYHLEYGWAAAGPLLFGVGLGLMYVASRRLLPAIAVHAGYDVWATFQNFQFV